MKKDLALIGGLFLIIVALLVFGQGFTSSGLLNKKPSPKGATQEASLGEQVNIKIKDLSLKAAVAATSQEHKKGLSGRDGLPLDWSLLFVFGEVKPHVIWMKGMRFAIDIIWIDENKKVVDIAESVPPEPSKKDKDLTRYTPRSDSKYILEMNAGLASLHNIQIGDSVEF